MTAAPTPTVIRDALNLVLDLQGGAATRTAEELRGQCAAVLAMLTSLGRNAPDLDDLVREVEACVNVLQPPSTSLVDNRGHIEWLQERRTGIPWQFWDRYKRYLETVDIQPRSVTAGLDTVTDSILRKLEDPTREGSWDRRGLVVGQVQSGKTSNYTGLICKAADAGYKLILVLTGTHNSLRSQTQLRLDAGFLGFDTQYQQRADDDKNQTLFGTGLMPGFPRLRAGSLTNSSDGGDFRDTRARNYSVPIGDYPVILVVKKNTSILSNILKWVRGVEGEDGPGGERTISRIPLLMIDDEADNASIDTSRLDADGASATNKVIRELLHTFQQSAYVGYTATPYANIYSGSDPSEEALGDDIFPRSFIESLRPPSNYFGAERMFGLGPDSEHATPLPVHRRVNDETTWMPPDHDRTWVPTGELPASLREAIRSFMLTCAARRARGQTHVHNSMLIHVTRFQDVQDRVADQVDDERMRLQNRLRYGDGNRPDQLLDELRELWERDFEATSTAAGVPPHLRVGWDAVREQLHAAVLKIEMRTMNGRSKDALEYYEQRRTGLSVIAVGGNKLSRGLTLEGLSVSYYLRASRMYDTLMQMGRWFGYRPGYEDLCRLYTTPELVRWYTEITLAQDELRRELEEMAIRGKTPEKYGLRVRTSAAGLSITASNKMRRAQRVRLSFSGGIPETIVFDADPAVLRNNLVVLDEFLDELAVTGQPTSTPRSRLWRAVPPATVVRFLERYRGDPAAVRSRPDLIARYITGSAGRGLFPSWDVALMSNSERDAESQPTTAGDVGMIVRALLLEGTARTADNELDQILRDARYTIRRVLSPRDETVNLTGDQIDEALRRTRTDPNRDTTKEEPSVPSGPNLRRQRRPDQGLLLLYVLDNIRAGNADRADRVTLVPEPMVGFVLSFPFAPGEDTGQEYAVNVPWQQLRLAGLDEEPDED